MLILAIDTSCDETSVAITWNDVILSNVISSQVELHKKYGGVVPMIAMRAHQERIDAVIQEAVKRANISISKLQIPNHKQISSYKSKSTSSIPSFVRRGQGKLQATSFGLQDVDVFAVTYGPGLAPALQIGVEKSKELARLYKKPLVAVNHMEGHIYSNFAKRVGVISKFEIRNSKQTNNSKLKSNLDFVLRASDFPVLCLLISGGHTELVLMKNHGKYEIIGETLDDAVGEAFDKVAKMLSLGYPGGPIVEELAKEGNPHKYPFPVPLEKSKTCDFSYSGLKTSVLYALQKISPKGKFTKKLICDLCASFQRAAVEHLVQKTTLAIKKLQVTGYKLQVTRLLLGGGVVANKLVRSEIRKAMKPFEIEVVYPIDKKLLGDNAAMIAIAAFHRVKRKQFVKNVSRLERDPGLRLGS